MVLRPPFFYRILTVPVKSMTAPGRRVILGACSGDFMFKMILAASTALTLLATPAFAQQVLRIGGAVDGELSKVDAQLDSGEYADRYTFQGRAGQGVRIRMTATGFDPYLMLRGPGGVSEDNDDEGEGSTDAALALTLPSTGTYTISATSYRAGETGRYHLQLMGDNPGQPSPPSSRRGATNDAQTIRPGSDVRGELGAGDDALSTGEYVDVWRFNARRGESYVATLSASQFDPYLLVRGPGDLSEDNDDDPAAGGSRNSRIAFTAQADGEITVSATSYEPGETGTYRLSLQRDGGGAQPLRSSSSGPAVGMGDVRTGRLENGDGQLESGEFQDIYRFAGRAGQELDLRMTSADFDPYLLLSGPDGFTAQNDDDPAGDTRDSRLLVRLPATGEYLIGATSYEPGERGAYQLSVLDGAGQVAERSAADNAPVQISIGEPVSGVLEAGDNTLNSGEYADAYVFTARRGQRIRAELTSSAFDAYIMLSTPSGEQTDNDDGDDGTDSVLDMVLAEDGEYRLRVTSYAPGETGSYRLVVNPSQGSARQVSVPGGARIFAVMVGVSDYGGVANDLPYTDDDARQLAETLRDAGSLNPASVVLTNAEATTQGVRDAFARVAAQAGPDDLFLFFFSGHGDRNETTTGPTEPDGQSESIVLRDGQISDTEMAQLFGTLNTRLALLVLDSCYSGGFARNVVDRPGVMGVFSSEEDLTSAVADKFRAGGYLSHFLRQGVAGAADADGDRLVTAGELATYLRRQFVTEVDNVEATTTDGQRNYQNLVIDRGGVQVDDVIVRLPVTD